MIPGKDRAGVARLHDPWTFLATSPFDRKAPMIFTLLLATSLVFALALLAKGQFLTGGCFCYRATLIEVWWNALDIDLE